MTVEQGFTEQPKYRPLVIERGSEGGFHVAVNLRHTIGHLTQALGISGIHLRSPFDITVNSTESVIHFIAANQPPQVKYPSALADTIAMTVVLPNGTVTPIRRGQYTSPPGGHFQVNGISIPSPEIAEFGMSASDLIDMYASPFSLGPIRQATINLRESPPSDLLVVPTQNSLQAKRVLIALKELVPQTLEPGGISELWYIDEETVETMSSVLKQRFTARNYIGDDIYPATLELSPTTDILHPDINAHAMIIANVEHSGNTLQSVNPLTDVVRVCGLLGVQTSDSLVPDADKEALLTFLQPYLHPAQLLRKQ